MSEPLPPDSGTRRTTALQLTVSDCFCSRFFLLTFLDETSPAAQGADADDHKGRHAVHDAHFLRDRRCVLNIRP